MDQTFDAQARVEASLRSMFATMNPLLSLGWTIAGVLLWLSVLAVGYLTPALPPMYFIAGTAVVTLLVVSFSVARLLVAGDVLRRVRKLRGFDLSDVSAEERLAAPAALLEPGHAVSVQHLDRLLVADPTDLRLPQRDLKRIRVQATVVNVTAVVAMVVCGLSGLILLAQVTSHRVIGDPVAWQLVAIAAVTPIALNSAVLWAFRQATLIEVARRFVVAQQILDSGDLPDDGGPLTAIVRRGARKVVNPRALPPRRAPRRSHLASAASGRSPLLLVQAWAFAALFPVVTTFAIVTSVIAVH